MTARDHHLASLDAFRGLAVAGMILVNSPGNWNSVFESLTHSDWNGCTFADLVFPIFVFILGAAMPFAFSRRIDQGHRWPELYVRIGRRAIWLVVLGLVLNLFAAIPSVNSLRIPGVLQRIGVVYLVTATLVLHVGPTWRTVMLIVLVVGHWALLTLVPFGGAAGGLAPSHNLQAFIDSAIFGQHMLSPNGDPEGIVGTIPAIGSALLGSLAGDWLRQHRSVSARSGGLIGGAAIVLVAALAWTSVLPLNKPLWTGSFVLFTGGVALLIFGACYVLLDVLDYQWWARPFLWLGFNPLAIYFFSEVAGHLLDGPWVHASGHTMTLRNRLFWDGLWPLVPGIRVEWISLLFALLTVVFWTAVASVLYRRQIRIQV